MPVGSRRFTYRSAQVSMRGMTVVASAHTPIEVSVRENPDLTVLIPFSGWSSATIGPRELRCQAKVTALYLPQVGRIGRSGTRSLLSLNIQRDRLLETAKAMLGPDQSLQMLAVDEPRLLPLRRHGLDLRRLLYQACGMIDLADLSSDRLELLGVDELLCRMLVMLLAAPESPTIFVADSQPADRSVIEKVCDYIEEHLNRPLTLTELQRETGLKPRAIQLGFQKHFARTPREWITERRLTRARQLLENGDDGTRVTAVALSCGFAKASAFSAAYAKHWGEKPSETLRRVVARRS